MTRTRTRQPQWASRIDLSNRVARGLVFASLPGVAVQNLVNGRAASTIGSGGVTVTSKGRARVFAASAAHRMNYAAPISSGDMTLLTVAIPSALSAAALLGVFAPGASAATSNYLSIESGPNYSAVSTDSANWSIATGPAPVVGKPVVLCGTFKASGARLLYLDGVYQAQNATGRNPAGLTDVVEGCYNGGSGTGYVSPFAGSILLSLVFNRVLSAAEVAAISSNPWQIFKGRRNFLPAIATVQVARPVADLSNTGWVPSSGATLYPMIGETIRDDGTYISATAVGALCEVDLTDLSDPAVSTGHLPTLVLSAPGGGGVTIRLRQGTTTIATWTYYPGATPTEYTPTLSGAEADSITDYTALRLQFEAVA